MIGIVDYGVGNLFSLQSSFAAIGQEAVVTQYIDNLHSSGEVVVNGQHWSARSVNPEHTIEKGEVVMIRSIEGVKLIVGKRIEPGKQE